MNDVLGNSYQRRSQRAERVRESGPLRHRGHRDARDGYADGRSEDQSNDDPEIVAMQDFRPEQSSNDCSAHSASGLNHAATRGVGMTETLEPKNKENGR